jgi:hypothetical protein
MWQDEHLGDGYKVAVSRLPCFNLMNTPLKLEYWSCPRMHRSDPGPRHASGRTIHT